MASPPVQLKSLLAELRRLLDPAGQVRVDELGRRLDDGVLRVLVVGEAKRGKSTLLNALCETRLLPTGVLPLTAVATTLRYGERPELTVRFRDGHCQMVAAEALAELVTETGNPGNRRGIAEVELHLPSPLLARGLELVDTPGVGSVYGHNTEAALVALDRMDAAIFVVSSDPPISAHEQEFLRRVHAASVRLYCVLNKADRLDPQELADARRFTRAVVEAELATSVEVYPMSARAAAAGREDEGFAAFRRDLDSYLGAGAALDVVRSITGRALMLAGSVAEAERAALAAGQASLAEGERLLAAFRGVYAEVACRRQEMRAIVAATVGRLQADTDEAAAAFIATEGPGLAEDARRFVTERQSRPAESERVALDLLAQRVQALVDHWRDEQQRRLAEQLDSLGGRLTGQLDDQIRRLRSAAGELFGVELDAWNADVAALGSVPVSYSFAPDPGQVDAMAAAVRRHLLGEWGRRRVERYLSEQALGLLDKHIGRARSGFQTALDAAGRRVTEALDRRFADGAGRISDAIASTAATRSAGQPEAQAEEENRHQRLTAAESLMCQLQQLRALMAEEAGTGHGLP